MKKKILSLVVGCMLLCTACGSTDVENKEDIGTIGQKEFQVDEQEQTTNEEKENETVSEEETLEKVDYSTYTKDYPIEKRSLDYYWNIDTSGFDKSMFDGIFSVYGYDVNGKLTGRNLLASGFEIDIDRYEKALDWDYEENYYWDWSELYKDGVVIGEVVLENYNNEQDFDSDFTQLDYSCSDATCTFATSIIPKSLVKDSDSRIFDALTIDDIIEHLGVPTYVEGRQDYSTKDLYFFKYLYVYDDYVLIYEFIYFESTGITFTGFAYEGMNIYDQPCQYYDATLGESINFNSPFEFLERDQNLYLESIK